MGLAVQRGRQGKGQERLGRAQVPQMGVGAQRKGVGGPGGVGARRSGGLWPWTYLSPATGATRGRDVPVSDSGQGLQLREDCNLAQAAGPSHPPGRRKKLQLSLERGGAGLLKGPHRSPGSLVGDRATPRRALGAKALKHWTDVLPG